MVTEAAARCGGLKAKKHTVDGPPMLSITIAKTH